MNNTKELLRQIPKIDNILNDQRLLVFLKNNPKKMIVEIVREEIDALRISIKEGEINDFGKLNTDTLIKNILKRIEEKNRSSLRPVINATGTIIHTNLGRARLSDAVCRRVMEVAANYSTLEYDVEKGIRGSRYVHIDKLITRITQAEAAMAVNNNAAALLLCLSALAKGKEVVVSRGELVEIGGSFRIPEIMEQGDVKLREVGTTNKTRIEDYKKAVEIGNVGMLLKVHKSNFKIMGFTEEASVQELVALGKKTGIPVVHDIGSGLMVDLKEFGIDEPTVQASLEAGTDLILFSGDKLLGGPQAGIIAGRREYIDNIKKHPLARVVRLDKMTLAALEATFREYIDPERAKQNIPVLSMIAVNAEEIKSKAEQFSKIVQERTSLYQVNIEATDGQIGGGTVPNQFLPGFSVTIEAESISPDRIERALRENQPPIIARICKNKLTLDMRTVSKEELYLLAEALVRIAENERENYV